MKNSVAYIDGENIFHGSLEQYGYPVYIPVLAEHLTRYSLVRFFHAQGPILTRELGMYGLESIDCSSLRLTNVDGAIYNQLNHDLYFPRKEIKSAEYLELWTGDKDYIPLITKAQGRGYKVRIRSYEAQLSTALARVADEVSLLGTVFTLRRGCNPRSKARHKATPICG